MSSSAISTELGQLALSNPPPPRRAAKGQSHIIPRAAAEEYDATSEDDDSEPSWTPSTSIATAGSRRGRKPANAALSRSAREAQRRENHSRIEKLRRTKINNALATLRELVPPEYSKQLLDSKGDDEIWTPSSPKTSKGGKRPTKEKEFKLEILIKTVSYMQDLIAQKDELEQKLSSCSCASINTNSVSVAPGSSQTLPEKRKSTEEFRDNARGGKRLHLSPSESPALPSIADWLPEPVEASGSTPYLPSPPSSTQFSTTSSQFVPPLSLGPPATVLPPPMGSPSNKFIRNTPPSPEEESAASMLLHIRSSRTSFVDQPLSELQAHTPSSIMGLSSTAL
ncbi:hypothetical protein DL96DRAFT_1067941 [Flagelloscypha sp. PMI_526]|nr:hypothetical protein DL96DRAFT_1067941 [Flagelloscypha sp. PMI_526]